MLNKYNKLEESILIEAEAETEAEAIDEENQITKSLTKSFTKQNLNSPDLLHKQCLINYKTDSFDDKMIYECVICFSIIDLNDRNTKYIDLNNKYNNIKKPCSCNAIIHTECFNKWYTDRGTCPICISEIKVYDNYYCKVLNLDQFYLKTTSDNIKTCIKQSIKNTICNKDLCAILFRFIAMIFAVIVLSYLSDL